jgi:type IV secretory pathway TrbL component
MLPNQACLAERAVVRRFVLFVVALAFVLVPWPATAAPPENFPARINLPNGFFPEGIENGRGTSVYVGSIANGAIWRGDVRTGSGAVFADGAQSWASIGIAYESSRNRLWVAGGGPSIAGSGDVRVGVRRVKRRTAQDLQYPRAPQIPTSDSSTT